MKTKTAITVRYRGRLQNQDHYLVESAVNTLRPRVGESLTGDQVQEIIDLRTVDTVNVKNREIK